MKQIQDFCPLWGVWHVEKRLGKGSFGTVWQMRREEMGQVYYAAVKHISIPQDADDVEMLKSEGMISDETSTCKYFDELVSSILYEIKMMDTLKGHTNIVSYEDYLLVPKEGFAGYDLFIRMELLTSLDNWKKERGMRRKDVIHLGVDIASAMDVLNKKGLVHRDIKPQNILVNDMGNFKLADFGTARALNNMSTAMSKKGTYNYMAPEVFRGDTANQTVDVYSLGMVLYHLTNRSRGPFLPLDTTTVRVEETEVALHKRMRGDPLPPPAYADEALSRIILKACAFNPKERYQSGAEMRDALLNVDKAAAVVPPVVTPPEKEKDPAPEVQSELKEEKKPQKKPEKKAEKKPEKEPAKSGKKRWIAVVAAIVVVLGIGAATIGGGKKQPAQPVDFQVHVELQTPVITRNPPTPTPTKTPTPTPRVTFTPSPSPTPKKTPTPTPKVTPTPEGIPLLGILDADGQEYTSGNFRYMVADDGTAHITGYNNDAAVTNEKIPEYLDGYLVTAIGYGAFSDATMTTLFIPNNVYHVNPEAFMNCYMLESFSVNSDHPTLKVDGGALIDMQTNTLIKYPAASLRRAVSVPEGVEAIGPQGFAYCQNLYSVKLPRSLKSIEGIPFEECRLLTYIDVAADHPVFGVQDDILYNKQDGTLVYYLRGTKKTEYTIPAWITRIGSYAFWMEENLQSVTIPSSVKEIDNHAFYGAQMIESVTLNVGVNTISNQAFSFMPKLKEIVLPESVETLMANAFLGCENLQSVIVPVGVKTIDANVFAECPNLSVTVEEGSYAHKYCLENNVRFQLAKAPETPTPKPTATPKPTPVPAPATVPPLAKVTRKTEYTGGEYRYVIADDGTAHIISYNGANSLDTLKVPEKLNGYLVTALKTGAFYTIQCDTVEIPDTLLYVEEGTFHNVDVKKFSVSSKHPTLEAVDGALIDKQQQMLLRYPVSDFRQTFRIPADVKQLGSSSFANSWYLKSVELPDGLQTIAEGAFENCGELAKMTVSAQHATFGVKDNILYDKKDGTLLHYLAANKADGYIIPSYIKRVGDNAFTLNKYLTHITVPSTVKEIGNCAFFGVQLESITFNEGIEYIGRQAFNCPTLETVTLPESLRELAGAAFLNCTGLKTVYVPAGVEKIGYDAFGGCPDLTVIVEEGSYAHDYCVNNKVRYQLAQTGTTCPTCGFVNEGGDAARFCGKCGTSLTSSKPAVKVCTGCGFTNEGDHVKFCAKCGLALK